MRRFASGVSHFVPVNGSRIHYQQFNAGDLDKPGLLFVHGMWAHLHWWDHIVPFFTDRFRVIAIDLGGMGDSETRPDYTAPGFTEELVAVLEDAGMLAATVVAHSFGGTPTIFACGLRPDLIARAVIIDSRLNIPTAPAPVPDKSDQMTSKRIYADPGEAISRYRLIPPGGTVAPDILRHVATHGLMRQSEGWVWKFDLAIDPQLFHHPAGLIPPITTPIDFIFGEMSRSVSAIQALAISDFLPNCGAPIGIPDTGHHILLEEPEILVSVLRALFARQA
ncbi:MAG: alpha/beta fold hydrolase [Sphingomonadaceae bacterium]